MATKAYLINLDRSPDRLAAVTADAQRAGIDVIRVPGVDGKAVPEAERTLLDEAAFLRDHGKRPLPGEYGCYASHLKALETFVRQGDAFGLVLEDDALLPTSLNMILREIEAVDDWDVVKLAHHRRAVHKVDRRLSQGLKLGRAVFGPTGSAAAYLVRQDAARRLLGALQPMHLPFDVALERGWHSGLRVRHLQPDPIALYGTGSLTRDGERYSARKLKPWDRITTLQFRTCDAMKRMTTALMGR